MMVGVGDIYGCGALDNDNGRRLISKKNEQTKMKFGWVPPLRDGYLIDRMEDVVLTNDS